jgi:hypothetical protein
MEYKYCAPMGPVNTMVPVGNGHVGWAAVAVGGGAMVNALLIQTEGENAEVQLLVSVTVNK